MPVQMQQLTLSLANWLAPEPMELACLWLLWGLPLVVFIAVPEPLVGLKGMGLIA